MLPNTYHILVWIHEDVEAIFPRQTQHLDSMLDPIFIIFPGSSGFNSLPGKDVSDGVVSPTLQPGKMDVGIFEGKGSGMKVDMIAVKELFQDM